jgi:hypothetical protein
VRWKRVKGAFEVEVPSRGEGDNIRGQAEVEAESFELAVFLRGILGGRVGQGARYARSEERQTFGVVFLGCLGRGD